MIGISISCAVLAFVCAWPFFHRLWASAIAAAVAFTISELCLAYDVIAPLAVMLLGLVLLMFLLTITGKRG